MRGSQNVQVDEVVDFYTDQRLSRGTRAFLRALNSPVPPELEKLGGVAARRVLETAQASVPVDYSGIDERQRPITVDGFEIVLNIVRPGGAPASCRCSCSSTAGVGCSAITLHIGASSATSSWSQGTARSSSITRAHPTPSSHGRSMRSTPRPGGSPTHGDEINVDGGNLAVVGNSVGGNMTAVTAIKAKENGGPPIKVHILMWPIVDADFETESYHQFGRDRFLSTPLMQWMYDMYIADPAKRMDIHASPLRASLEQLKGLPPR